MRHKFNTSNSTLIQNTCKKTAGNMRVTKRSVHASKIMKADLNASKEWLAVIDSLIIYGPESLDTRIKALILRFVLYSKSK